MKLNKLVLVYLASTMFFFVCLGFNGTFSTNGP